MSINDLYVAMTGWDSTTRVNLFKHNQKMAYYHDRFEGVQIDCHSIEEIHECGYGGKQIEHFSVTALTEDGWVASVSILLSE